MKNSDVKPDDQKKDTQGDDKGGNPLSLQLVEFVDANPTSSSSMKETLEKLKKLKKNTPKKVL